MRHILIILLLSGCGKATPGLFFNSLDPVAEAQLRKASAELFSVVSLDRRVTISGYHDEGTIGGHACVGCSDCQIKINLNHTSGETSLRATLYHEFGHCVGLEHSTGVMSPNGGAGNWWPNDESTFIDNVKLLQTTSKGTI